MENHLDTEIKLLRPQATMIEDTIDFLKKIEICGRTCYKSEDKMTSDSAVKFVKMLCSRGHTAMLEHSTIYFVDSNLSDKKSKAVEAILSSPYTFKVVKDDTTYVTTNFRVIYNSFYQSFDAAYNFVKSVEPKLLSPEHIRRYSFRIICDRGVSHELVRHRVFSFAQESTRYVNSAKKGFEFILPAWWDNCTSDNGQLSVEQFAFIDACKHSAATYEFLLSLGQTPQQARAVLPNALKTEIVMTGTEPQWREFLKLRTAKDAHPDMQIIANMIRNEFIAK